MVLHVKSLLVRTVIVSLLDIQRLCNLWTFAFPELVWWSVILVSMLSPSKMLTPVLRPAMELHDYTTQMLRPLGGGLLFR